MTLTSSDDLLVRREGRVVVLTLNRPDKRNALSDRLFGDLIATLQTVEQDGDVAVIVLTGAGKAFCAGGDVRDMPADGKALTFEQRVSDLRRRADVVRLLAESSKVTIAAINGVAAGAGLSLALACDLRLAAASASFVTAFIRMGLSGDCGCVHLLSNLVGATRAKEMCLLGDTVSAREAADMNLVTRCVPDAELEAESMALACRLAAGPSVAHRYMKENFRKASEPLASALSDEAVFLVRSATSEDHAEAKRAFLEKRAARFSGR